MGYILIALTILISFICSYAIRKIQVSSKKSYHMTKPVIFHIDAQNPIICSYVSKMDNQHKSNSRLLNGSGKMHYVEMIASGSDAIRNKNLSVLRNLGDRFS